MRLSRNVVAAGAAIGLLAVAGTAVAQEHATRTIQVPANAVVLVLPPGVRVLTPDGMNPAALDAASPARFGMAPSIDAMFSQMDARMDAIIQAAEHGFATPMTGPGRTFQAMMDGVPQGGSSSVVVTSFSDGSQSCTQRVVYDVGRAPVVQTSRNDCGAMMQRMTPAVQRAPRARGPRLIEASAHDPARPYEVAYAGR